MRKSSVLMLIVLMFPGWHPVRADSPAVTARGIGARASALGNSFVALADDYTATYWNPAGLSFATFREVQFSLEYLPHRTAAAFGGNTDTAAQQRMRLGHIGWLRSLPTTRGGFAFAIGYSRPYLLDNIYNYHGIDTYRGDTPRIGYYYDVTSQGDTIPYVLHPGEKLRYASSGHRMYGHLGLLTGAVGWQVGPGLGLGFAASLVTGREQQEHVVHSYLIEEGEQIDFQHGTETIEGHYTGADLRAGLLYTPDRRFSFGIRLCAPQFIMVRHESTYRDSIYTDYVDYRQFNGTMRSSFTGALGFALRLPFVTVSTEGGFRAPFAEANEKSPRAYWKGGAGVGAEAPIPHTPLVLRAGYAWRQLDLHPYLLEWDNNEKGYEPRLSDEEDVKRISGGMAVLFKDILALEATYRYSWWGATVHSPEWKNAVREDHTTHRVLMSFSFRY